MEELIDIKGFTSLIRDTYTFDEKKYYSIPEWGILCNLYNKNFIFADKSIQKIPKNIHQIWLGSSLPVRYNEWTKKWQEMHPDWKYKLWTDDDLNEENIHIKNWNEFNNIANMAQKSHYLRYHILYQFGGIYADTDYECLKSFDELRYTDFFAGITYDPYPNVNIAILGSVPNHPILKRLIDNMIVKKGDKAKNVFSSTGPCYFTKCFFDEIGNYKEGVIALPPQFFYPFPNQIGYKDRNAKEYIKDYSYGVHYWDITWIKTKK